MGTVFVIEGLGSPGSSPIAPLVFSLKSALPDDVEVVHSHWKMLETSENDPVNFFKQGEEVVLCGHSLGSSACVWLAYRLQEFRPDVIIRKMILEDPVPGDVDHPWAQFFVKEIELPDNVQTAVAFLKRHGIPISRPLAEGEGDNVYIDGADHNTLCGIVQADVVCQVVEIFGRKTTA